MLSQGLQCWTPCESKDGWQDTHPNGKARRELICPCYYQYWTSRKAELRSVVKGLPEYIRQGGQKGHFSKTTVLCKPVMRFANFVIVSSVLKLIT